MVNGDWLLGDFRRFDRYLEKCMSNYSETPDA